MNYFRGEFLSEWLQFSEESYNCLLQETTVSNSPLNFMSRLSSYSGAVYNKTWVLNGYGLTDKNAYSSSPPPLPPHPFSAAATSTSVALRPNRA